LADAGQRLTVEILSGIDTGDSLAISFDALVGCDHEPASSAGTCACRNSNPLLAIEQMTQPASAFADVWQPERPQVAPKDPPPFYYARGEYTRAKPILSPFADVNHARSLASSA